MHAASVCPEPESNSPTKEETDPFGTVIIASSSNGLLIDESALVFVPATFQLLKIGAQASQTDLETGLMRMTIIPTGRAVRQPR
jgi:hypothetical protein